MDNKDIITDVFSTLRISGDLYFRADLRGDFSIEIPSERRCIRFHLVRQGSCQIAVPGADISPLREGDLAIVPNGASQVLTSGLPTQIIPLGEVITKGNLTDGVLTYGIGHRDTRLLCGFCHFDEAVDHPVLANLPDLMILRPADQGSDPWVAASLRLLALEADLSAQGSGGILARMLEILFIQCVRDMTWRFDGQENGFIAALSDVQLGRALEAIHTRLEAPWTVAGLAALSGMSRARFAHRFTDSVGMPPIDYLTQWRLMKARSLLAASDLDMNEIAHRCGYASAPSFSRRFKRNFGVGPGAYRRSNS